MKATTIKTVLNKVTEIDGKPVVYGFSYSSRPFPNMSQQMFMRLRLPSEFAVCKDNEQPCNVILYGRYGTEWFTCENFSGFVIQHLLHSRAEENFQDSY